MDNNNFLSGHNAVFLEHLYQKYIEDPSSLDSSWVLFFQNYYHNEKKLNHNLQLPSYSVSSSSLQYKTCNQCASIGVHTNNQTGDNNSYTLLQQLQIQQLITAYRSYGHLYTTLDPLGIYQVDLEKKHKHLGLEAYNLSYDTVIQEDVSMKLPSNFADIRNLQQLVNQLEHIYCSNVGVEFDHINDCSVTDWLYNQFENLFLDINNTKIDQLQLLQNLIAVTGLEEFLHTKFIGAKRFSIQGGESVIAALMAIVEQAADHSAKEVVIGMAHRGRLAALAEVTKKPYYKIMSEFANGVTLTDVNFSGDVKYHMGYSNIYTSKQNNNIKVSITPNPSHLEAVNSVVMGQVRAKQDMIDVSDRQQYIGILVHGDAAFSGQGIVTESLLLSSKSAYDIGGVIHIVINNQVGFTSTPEETYIGRYTTEIAKAIDAPIIHVNGDNPEIVLKVIALAMAYKQKFAKDIVIDIICYRKYGHNEGDEPMFTQPLMYNIVKNKLSVADSYAQQLLAQKTISDADYNNMRQRHKDILDKEFEKAKSYQVYFPEKNASIRENNINDIVGDSKVTKNVISDPIKTGIETKLLLDINNKLCTIPDNFNTHPRLKRLLNERLTKVNEDNIVDWAAAEQIAYASLLLDNFDVRITGQDVCRGTFSHRHAVLYSQSNNSTYVPLNNLSKQQAHFHIANSPLSEYGVLGFEYGYSLVDPSKKLVIWEAQFGDFSNGAQIIFDQFISSAETKWQLNSNIVMLLPHGYEGQGPEHSSARLERYLQLAANNNIKVAYPTTPASLFHLLRRQVLSQQPKPLIVMAPKSLLRHRLVVSKINELGIDSHFEPIIDEIDTQIASNNDKISKVIICSGKVFYDLYEYRAQQNITDSVIIRVEQYYPFSVQLLSIILKKYHASKKIIWCQEEPKNMGAWSFIKSYLEDTISKLRKNHTLHYVGRDAASSPAVGYVKVHQQQQEELIKKAFNI